MWTAFRVLKILFHILEHSHVACASFENVFSHLLTYVCLFMHTCIQTDVPTSVRRSETTCMSRFSLFSLCVLGSNTGHQSWWQAPLPTDPSHKSGKHILRTELGAKRINELNLEGKQNYCISKGKNPKRVLPISSFMLKIAMLKI